MLPYIVDPAWYELTWYGQPRHAVPDKRPSLAVRLGLSAALVAWTLVVLGRVV
jgi:hypothetical protein